MCHCGLIPLLWSRAVKLFLPSVSFLTEWIFKELNSPASFGGGRGWFQSLELSVDLLPLVVKNSLMLEMTIFFLFILDIPFFKKMEYLTSSFRPSSLLQVSAIAQTFKFFFFNRLRLVPQWQVVIFRSEIIFIKKTFYF